jgi:hypothetical protein
VVQAKGLMSGRWVVTCHSSQYPSHWKTSAAPAREMTANVFSTAQEHLSRSCPVRSLRVLCNDYLKRRPNRKVPGEGVKERVFWGSGADSSS